MGGSYTATLVERGSGGGAGGGRHVVYEKLTLGVMCRVLPRFRLIAQLDRKCCAFNVKGSAFELLPRMIFYRYQSPYYIASTGFLV